MKQPYLLCAKVLNTHGVRGMLKLELYCDSCEAFAALPCVYTKGKNGVMHACDLRSAAPHGRFVLAALEGIDSLDAALPLKGKELYAKREDIRKDANDYFLADLIGLAVIDEASGKVYGHIKEVNEAPASLLYVIETEHGDVLFPAVPAFVRRVDTESGVYIHAIEGFFS